MTRYIAQDVSSGEFLNWNMPLDNVTVTYPLSGPREIAGELSPEMPHLNLSAYEEWATWLHLEQDGYIRASGILQPLSFDGPTVRVAAVGFTGYAQGIPYLGEYSRIQVDPLDAARQIWTHLQSYPTSLQGVTLDGTQSPIRIGEPERDQVKNANDMWKPAADYGGLAQFRKDAGTLRDAVGDDVTIVNDDFSYEPSLSIPAIPDNTRRALRAGYTGDIDDRQQIIDYLDRVVKGESSVTRTVDAQPYQLVWWSPKDCGSEFNSLAKETPFDYRETSQWNADKTDITHHINLGYPRLGRKRDDLRFAEGENVSNPIPYTKQDTYASEVHVLGAGEGRKRIHAVASEAGEKLRRVAVIEDKDIETHRRAKRIALDELRRRQAVVSFEQITVDVSDPNAKWGSFSEGDDILVEGDFPWLGRQAVWHRIVSMRLDPKTDSAELSLIPSASVYYGPPVGGAA